MKAVIPSISIKGFQAVLTCLSKIGDDVIVEARPDRLCFSTMNITRSAYASFAFTRSFFESYHVDTSGDAIQHDLTGPFLRCKVLAKALVSACKIRGNIAEKTEKLSLVMDSAEGVGENCRLAIDIFFKHGFIKIHKLLYEACPDNLGVVSSKGLSRNSWRIPAAGLNGLVENFSSKAEEISIRCMQSGLEFKTSKDSSGEEGAVQTRVGKTCVPLDRSAMDLYNLQEEIDLAVTMKEFKSIVAFAVTLRLPLDCYFDKRNRSIALTVVSENILTGTFELASIIENEEMTDAVADINGSQQQQHQQQAASNGPFPSQFVPAGAEGLDLTQPENALYLDDDAEWAVAFDDMEMEEEEALQDNRPTLRKNGSSSAAGAASTSIAAGTPHGPRTVQSATGQGNMDLELDDDEAYEVEEHEFLPPEKPNKKMRYVFDDE